MNRFVLSAVAALGFAAPAFSGSELLIIANGDGGSVQRLTDGQSLRRITSDLRDRDITASIATRTDTEGMWDAFLRFSRALDRTTDDVAIVLTGKFVTTHTGTYLMPANVQRSLTLSDVLAEGFPVDAVYAVAAEYQGRALVVAGEETKDLRLAPGLKAWLPLQDIPQGVSVAYGNADAASHFANQLGKRVSTDQMAAARRAGLKFSGYVPPSLAVFAPIEGDIPTVVEEDTGFSDADNAAWDTAIKTDTEAAYETYLRAYPSGAKAQEARQRLTAIRAEPFYREKQIEADLALDREARREIQRDLSVLGYNTRGVDGIFGPGTRGAVKSWQDVNDYRVSGYLNADQISRLDGQAERRRAALEEEARIRQARLERRDRAYWADTGARGDEQGFRDYLKEYPDGIFAEVALGQLEEIEADRREKAASLDRSQWERARHLDTVESYRVYLQEMPDGAFVEEARARIDRLNRNAGNAAIQQKARAEENSLGLNAAARRLAEVRLQQLGLKPGVVDGRFDEASRRAIRRYQDARNLRVSGYLDQATVVRLMADTILR